MLLLEVAFLYTYTKKRPNQDLSTITHQYLTQITQRELKFLQITKDMASCVSLHADWNKSPLLSIKSVYHLTLGQAIDISPFYLTSATKSDFSSFWQFVKSFTSIANNSTAGIHVYQGVCYQYIRLTITFPKVGMNLLAQFF